MRAHFSHFIGLDHFSDFVRTREDNGLAGAAFTSNQLANRMESTHRILERGCARWHLFEARSRRQFRRHTHRVLHPGPVVNRTGTFSHAPACATSEIPTARWIRILSSESAGNRRADSHHPSGYQRGRAPVEIRWPVFCQHGRAAGGTTAKPRGLGQDHSHARALAAWLSQ